MRGGAVFNLNGLCLLQEGGSAFRLSSPTELLHEASRSHQVRSRGERGERAQNLGEGGAGSGVVLFQIWMAHLQGNG